MSLINMQDGIVKSSLVQQVQSRGVEDMRAMQSANLMSLDEQARQADETVQQTPESENQGIRDDAENPQGQNPRRRRRGAPDEDESENKGDSPIARPPDSDNPHRIDIVI